MKETDKFFAFVNERERIRLLKENEHPGPWTKDPILREYRFCNVFREDDRTTKFFRETVRQPLRDENAAVLATIGWRWFNRIETCSRITLHEWREMDLDNIRAALRDCSPLVTGAYLVNTPTGMNKLEGILKCLEIAERWTSMFKFCHVPISDTLEHAHEMLMENVPYLGRFMAYEVVTDLRHTFLLEDAVDIMSWASAGPGCCRGAGRVLAGSPTRFKYGTKTAQREVLGMMVRLLERSRTDWLWAERPWEMREVEHSLCEYDKYRRAQEGGRLKRRRYEAV